MVKLFLSFFVVYNCVCVCVYARYSLGVGSVTSYHLQHMHAFNPLENMKSEVDGHGDSSVVKSQFLVA